MVALHLSAALADDPATPERVFHGFVALAGKQVVLPEGDWILAGQAYETVPSLEGVPYGAMESVVLFKLAATPAKTVAAFVIARANVISIEDGWGTAPECLHTDLLQSAVYDDSEGHNFCGFVTYVLSAVDDGSDRAWKQAVGYANAQGFALPTTWLAAGFRLSDFSDVLDVRYNFNPDLQGIPASMPTSWASSEWSRAQVFGADTSTANRSTIASLFDRVAFWRPSAPTREPAANAAAQQRAELVNDLKQWLARMRYPVELGFDKQAADLAPLPPPWPAAETAAPALAVRLAALEQLRDRHILDEAGYERQRAIAEQLSAPELAGAKWTAEELTTVKAITDQVSGAIGYFGADLVYTGTIATASQLWGLDQFLDLVRYTAQEYLWQKFGPRKLKVDEAVALPPAGIDG